jgi:hypothetical protein
MSSFHESQLEQAFVELFQKEGYDYVYGECILRDTRDVILYDDLRFYLRKKYKTDHITEDEINRVIARLETSDGGWCICRECRSVATSARRFFVETNQS